MFPSELQCGRNASGRHVVVCLVFLLPLSLNLFSVERVKNKTNNNNNNNNNNDNNKTHCVGVGEQSRRYA